MKLNQHNILWVCVLSHFFTSSRALLQVGRTWGSSCGGSSAWTRKGGEGETRWPIKLPSISPCKLHVTRLMLEFMINPRRCTEYKVHSIVHLYAWWATNSATDEACMYALLQLWTSDNSRTGHNDSTSSFSEKNISHHKNDFPFQIDTKLENPTKLHVLESHWLSIYRRDLNQVWPMW